MSPEGAGSGRALASSGCLFCFGELRVGAGLSLQFGPGPPSPQHSWWAGPPGLDHSILGNQDLELLAEGCLPSTHLPLLPTSGLRIVIPSEYLRLRPQPGEVKREFAPQRALGSWVCL